MKGIEIRITDEQFVHLAEGGPKYGPELLKFLEERVGPWLDMVLTTRIEKELRGTADKFEIAAVKTAFYHKIVEDHRERMKASVPVSP